MSSRITKALAEHRLIFILRAGAPGGLADMVASIWSAGGRFVEVTLNTPGALDTLGALSGRVPMGCYLGAGTVCSPEQVREVAAAGVSFVVTPVASKGLVAAVREADLLGIIGASTPTEVHNAHSWGADFVKVFPVQSPDYVRTLLGPLNGIPLVAVGGVKMDNAQRYLRAGCAGVAVGTSVFNMSPDGRVDPSELKAAVAGLVRVCELSREVV